MPRRHSRSRRRTCAKRGDLIPPPSEAWAYVLRFAQRRMHTGLHWPTCYQSSRSVPVGACMRLLATDGGCAPSLRSAVEKRELLQAEGWHECPSWNCWGTTPAFWSATASTRDANPCTLENGRLPCQQRTPAHSGCSRRGAFPIGQKQFCSLVRERSKARELGDKLQRRSEVLSNASCPVSANHEANMGGGCTPRSNYDTLHVCTVLRLLVKTEMHPGVFAALPGARLAKLRSKPLGLFAPHYLHKFCSAGIFFNENSNSRGIVTNTSSCPLQLRFLTSKLNRKMLALFFQFACAKISALEFFFLANIRV